ncbi:MAG: hypothetical protein K1X89_20515 [Myxococcaceae bacterium]|nr:hypothetical protein [Myxococcaceae bacterium]
MRFGRFEVFLYESMLDTRGPLLKELYCESHRQEPWALHGTSSPWGVFWFPGVLAIDAQERARELGWLRQQLVQAPGYALEVEQRFAAECRGLLKRLHALRAGRGDARQVFLSAGRVLSSGIFKEVLEPQALAEALEGFLPLGALRSRLPALYQPRCLPHGLKQHAMLLFAAAHLPARGRDRAAHVRRAALRSGYLSAFAMEDAALDAPRAMEAALEALKRRFGTPRRLLAQRRALFARHRARVRESEALEAELLSAAASAGPATLSSRRTLRGLLRMVAFIATSEELKHVLALRAIRGLRSEVERRGLSLETATLSKLERSPR